MKKGKISIADIFIYIFIVAGMFFIAYVASLNFTNTGFKTPEEAIKQYYSQYATFGKEEYKKIVKDFTEENFKLITATREAYSLKATTVDKIFEPEYEGAEAAMTPVFITFEMDIGDGKTIKVPQYDFVLTIKYKGKWHVVEQSNYPDGFEGWNAQMRRDYMEKEEFKQREEDMIEIVNNNQKFYEKARNKYSEILGLAEEE